MAELRRRRIQPGGHVAVAGFDNSPEAPHMDPPLTSVDTYMTNVGKTAARVLLSRVAEPGRRETASLLAPNLEERSSSRLWRPDAHRAGPELLISRPRKARSLSNSLV
jgi:LacI family transcriptional regulator